MTHLSYLLRSSYYYYGNLCELKQITGNQLTQGYKLSQLNTKTGNCLIFYTWTAKHTSSLCNTMCAIRIKQNIAARVWSIYGMYAVYLHDGEHVWLHGHTEKSLWHLSVRNDIKFHIQFSCPCDAWALCLRTHSNHCELSIIFPKMV